MVRVLFPSRFGKQQPPEISFSTLFDSEQVTEEIPHMSVIASTATLSTTQTILFENALHEIRRPLCHVITSQL